MAGFDEAFPPEAENERFKGKSFDELFPVEVEKDRYRRQTLGTSPIQDLIFGDTSVNPIARVLDHFRQGAAQTWGADDTTRLSKESEDFLKVNKQFDAWNSGQNSLIKAANESLFRPAAVQMVKEMHDAEALYRGVGAIFHGGQAAVSQIGEEMSGGSIDKGMKATTGLLGTEVGTAKLGHDIAGAVEALPTGFRAPTGIPHAPPHPALVEARNLQTELERARSLGVIGAGEEGYLGTRAPEVAPPISGAQEAARPVEAPVAEAPKVEATPEPGLPAPEPAAPEAPKDVHAVARDIAPDVFSEYDALTARQDTFRRWISELRDVRDEEAAKSAPHVDEINKLQAKIDDSETSPRLRKKYEERIAPLIEERDAHIADATKGDTSDMTNVRQKLMEVDYQRRDLAPEVTRAYQAARERMPQEAPPEAAAPVEAAPPVTAEAAPETTAKPSEAIQEPAKVSQPPVQPPAAPVRAAPIAPEHPIAVDVAKRLQVAGRPAEEARAAGVVQAAYWETRAARFEGRKGTAAEMYAKEAPAIKAGRGVEPAQEPALELAQIKRGHIRIPEEGGRNTITLLKDANASTFIHETGHDWLDRMMKDAVDPAAPTDLVADSNTVLKWLGVEKAEDIKTRQHEKFARGFENYMMEGRAPSQALATVFEKFKDWLTKIYTTVKALKAPIDADIRAVFDRMLAEKPEKTVIAPDRESPKTFADIHETDAIHTTPEAARPVAQTIQAERDMLANEHIPEEHDARLEGVTSGAGRREARGPQPDRHGNAPEPIAGEGRSAQEPGAVSAGGSEAPAESARPSVGGGKTEPPVSPQGSFSGPDSALVDKAGNIRLDNLGTPEDVNQAIRDAAVASNDFIDARRGVVTDGQVLELADALGMDAGQLNQRKLGQAFNAEQIMAARKLLIQSATAVRDAMVKAAAGSEADILAYAEAKTRFQMIANQVAGVTAEAGRALRAFRKLEGQQEAGQLSAFLKDTTGKTLFQLQREAQLGSQLPTPADVSRFVNESGKPTWKDKLIELWMSFLLSGPKTHAANMIGNTISGLLRPVETAIAAGVGKARNVVTGTQDRVLLGEAKAELFGAFQGSREGIVAAYKAYKTEEPQLTSVNQIERGHQKAIPSATVNVLGREMDVGGKQLRIPLRLLGAEDEFFKATSFRGSINRQAYELASKENLPPERFNARVAELSMNPTEEMVNKAKDAADYLAFQKPLGDTGRKAQNFINSHIALKFIVPFVRTPVNLLKYAGERTPLGVFSAEVRDNLSGKNGAVARDTQIARITLGTMVGVATFSLASEGLITGGGPNDPKQRAIMQAEGWQPYSVKIGGMYYAYNRLDPFSIIMGVVADAHEIYKASNSDHPEKEHLASLLFAAITKNITDRASLKGPSDLIQAVTNNERYGKSYINGMVGTAVPALFAQTAQAIDPTVREARTMIDYLKSRTPFLSETLHPKRDVWGEPMVREGGFGPDIGSPIMERRLKNDPVNQALIAANYFPAKLDRKIRGVELTDQQYDDFSRIGGRMAKVRLNAIVSIPGFSQMPEVTRKELMTNAITTSREAARSLIMMQNPEIIKKATDAKLEKLRH